MSIDNCSQQQKTQTKTTSKSTLSAYYQIDRTTLNKWLILFCTDIFGDEKTIINLRNFTDLQIGKIKEKLGLEPQFYWKKDLIKIAETDYKTIRDNIKLFPQTYGISENDYRSLSKFPPKIAQRIINALG